jgi:hypothetical protein
VHVVDLKFEIGDWIEGMMSKLLETLGWSCFLSLRRTPFTVTCLGPLPEWAGLGWDGPVGSAGNSSLVSSTRNREAPPHPIPIR